MKAQRQAIPPPLRFLWDFPRFLLRQYLADRCMQNAAALTYTTLLSLVPLMAVCLSMFSLFPAFDRVSEQVQDFVFKNFVPTSGEVLQTYLQGFAEKASHLTGLGAPFLVITALLMVATIDRSFASIWHSKPRSNRLRQFMVYWTMLSLGPLLIGFSMLLTSYIFSLPFLKGAEGQLSLESSLLPRLPFLLSALGFSLFYIIVPNRRVPIRYALVGGLVAALLFEVGKYGFALYISYFPTYEAIYGTLSTIPVFLIWIYLCWSIALIGAELTHCLDIYSSASSNTHGAKCSMHLCYRLLGHLWQAQQQGQTLSEKNLIKKESERPEKELIAALDTLAKANFIVHTQDHGWVLKRDMHNARMIDLYQARPFVLPSSTHFSSGDAWDTALQAVLAEFEPSLQAAMDIPLATLLEKNETTNRP